MTFINKFIASFSVLIAIVVDSSAQSIDCDTIRSCYSIVTDTSLNPFTTGILGNWRSNKSFTYYTSRLEADPSVATNIRTDGTFLDFGAFWKFEGGALKQRPDTTYWVWNSELTKFNQKGLEIENRDPLNRYNSGLYGYNQTMPTAVIQNAGYRESGFDGFEDYDYSTESCNTECPTKRHFDFSQYKSDMTTLFKHSGKKSLRVPGGNAAGLSCSVVNVTEDAETASLTFTTKQENCSSTGNSLSKITVPASILIPSFSPFRGKHMVISGWAKEDRVCNCSTYTATRATIVFGSVSTTFNFIPSGSIIEGWQRFEGDFEIPAGATSMTMSLEATDPSTAVYFDDIRLHPFNANMKSYVYNPIDLRLMAELDENNYASFYEYDDDGTLIRVKKETQRGIKTIKETRSALIKQ